MSLYSCFCLAYAEADPAAGALMLRMIIWGVVIGVAVGAAISVIQRRSLGAFVRAIKNAGAETPETAKTLAELGLGLHPLVRLALRAGQPMRRYARCVEDERAPAEAAVEGRVMTGVRRVLSLPEAERPHTRPRDAHFYIPHEALYTAESRYSMKGTHIPGLIVAIAVLIALGCFAEVMIPDLLTMAGNFLTQVSG